MAERAVAALRLPRIHAALEDGNNVSDAFVLREADEEDEKLSAAERKAGAESAPEKTEPDSSCGSGLWPCWPSKGGRAGAGPAAEEQGANEDPSPGEAGCADPAAAAMAAAGAGVSDSDAKKSSDALVRRVRCSLQEMPPLGTVPGIIDRATLDRSLPSASAVREAKAAALAANVAGAAAGVRNAPLYVTAPLFTGLRARQLLYTLAGVPPAHDSAGRVVAGFGHNPQALRSPQKSGGGSPGSRWGRGAETGAAGPSCSVHVYPNLSLVSLPRHLTWVLPAGKITDREAAERHMQARLPVQEAMLLRKLRPLTLERVAEVGSKSMWEVNVLDELCFFICGNPFQDGDAQD